MNILMSSGMKTRELVVSGLKVTLAEAGRGAPLVYLHGFADIHAASVGALPFHEQLARSARVIAPAHPGCAGSEEDEGIESIDDVAFRYIEIIDALGLARFDLAGSCVGGWIAAEIAVRHPERVKRLVLIGASGLFLEGKPTGDLFMEIQPLNGSSYAGLRELMFARADTPEALALLPDGRSALEVEMSRYKAMRFCSRVGFSPPYFYNRKLRARLARYQGPALLLWGESDRMVPLAHAHAYEAGLRGAKLVVVPGAGHSPHLERTAQTLAAVKKFLGAGAAARSKTAARNKPAAPAQRVVKKASAKAIPAKPKRAAAKPATGKSRLGRPR